MALALWLSDASITPHRCGHSTCQVILYGHLMFWPRTSVEGRVLLFSVNPRHPVLETASDSPPEVCRARATSQAFPASCTGPLPLRSMYPARDSWLLQAPTLFRLADTVNVYPQSEVCKCLCLDRYFCSTLQSPNTTPLTSL